VDLAAVVVHCVTQSGQRSRFPASYNNMTNGSGVRTEWVIDLIRATSTRDNEYGLLRGVVSIESSERRPVQHCGWVGSSSWKSWLVSTWLTTTRSVRGDRPMTPLPLGFRPAGTSLMSLGRTTSCRLLCGRAFPRQVCPARSNRAYRVDWCTPAGKINYSNSRVHGNRTLGVVSGSHTTMNYYRYKLNC